MTAGTGVSNASRSPLATTTATPPQQPSGPAKYVPPSMRHGAGGVQ